VLSQQVGYAGVVYWDLKHNTPREDDVFTKQLAGKLAEAIQPFDKNLSDEITAAGESVGDVVKTVLSLLSDDKKRILLIINGLDKVLSSSSISRNFWDYIRDLALGYSLRIVTGSQKPLREICFTKESQTSDFWEIFAQRPVRLGPLQSKDFDHIAEPLKSRQIEFTEDAIASVFRWTGGVPLLLAALLNEVSGISAKGCQVNEKDIDKCGDSMMINISEVLDSLWSRIPFESRVDLVAIRDGDITVESIGRGRADYLVNAGFITDIDNNLTLSCHAIERVLADKHQDLHSINHLFTHGKYTSSMRDVLELRLAGISCTDAALNRLRTLIGLMLADIETDTIAALNHLRSVLECSIDVIWYSEDPTTTRNLPGNFLTFLQTDNWWKERLLEKISNFGNTFPPSSERATCLTLIDMITRGPNKLSSQVSRASYILLNHIKATGDYTNHRDGSIIESEFAIAN